MRLAPAPFWLLKAKSKKRMNLRSIVAGAPGAGVDGCDFLGRRFGAGRRELVPFEFRDRHCSAVVEDGEFVLRQVPDRIPGFIGYVNLDEFQVDGDLIPERLLSGDFLGGSAGWGRARTEINRSNATRKAMLLPLIERTRSKMIS